MTGGNGIARAWAGKAGAAGEAAKAGVKGEEGDETGEGKTDSDGAGLIGGGKRDGSCACACSLGLTIVGASAGASVGVGADCGAVAPASLRPPAENPKRGACLEPLVEVVPGTAAVPPAGAGETSAELSD